MVQNFNFFFFCGSIGYHKNFNVAPCALASAYYSPNCLMVGVVRRSTVSKLRTTKISSEGLDGQLRKILHQRKFPIVQYQ